MLPTFESDHRNGLHNGSPRDLCALCGTRKYEVQFKDGLGAWRRWSLSSTWDKAHESRKRLRERVGPSGQIRIRERR